MEKHVRLKIFTPDKVYKEQDVRRVDGSPAPGFRPGADGDLTVLPERAPTVMVLTNGYIRVLDEHDGITDKYFIRGGIANIADDICAISTEGVVSEDDISKYGIINYVSWRANRKRKREVVRRYNRKMSRVDEQLKNLKK